MLTTNRWIRNTAMREISLLPGGSTNDDDARVYSRAIERGRLVMLVSL
jgi:hypothetical protein